MVNNSHLQIRILLFSLFTLCTRAIKNVFLNIFEEISTRRQTSTANINNFKKDFRLQRMIFKEKPTNKQSSSEKVKLKYSYLNWNVLRLFVEQKMPLHAKYFETYLIDRRDFLTILR